MADFHFHTRTVHPAKATTEPRLPQTLCAEQPSFLICTWMRPVYTTMARRNSGESTSGHHTMPVVLGTTRLTAVSDADGIANCQSHAPEACPGHFRPTQR